jgi:hypothetical protein
VRLGRRACDVSQGIVIMRERGAVTAMIWQQQGKSVRCKTARSRADKRVVTVVKFVRSGCAADEIARDFEGYP